MYFVQVNFADGHFVAGIVEVVFEQLEILFVDFPHQMLRQIVEVVLNGVQPLWAVPFAFVKARDGSQGRPYARGLDFVQGPACMPSLNCSVQMILSYRPAVHDEGRDVS